MSLKKNKPRQLSLLNPERTRFFGRRGWSLAFKPSKDGQLMTVIGELNDVYDALHQWIDDFPSYYSAVIYAPNGAIHRTYKSPDKVRS